MAQRLFVSVRPPPAVCEVLAGLPRPAEPGVRWVPPDQWHVTLRFLGRADETEVLAALEAAAASGALAAARAVLGPVVSRLGRSVIVVPVSGLDGLAGAVIAATRELGEPPDPRGFSGHLTLGRIKGRGTCALAGTPVSAAFETTGLELVSSTTRPGGALHEVLARVPVGIDTRNA